MASRKTIYRIKSTGQLVIHRGSDIKITSSQIKGAIVYELLDENLCQTGQMISVAQNDLEIAF